jgi:hypothetical protein
MTNKRNGNLYIAITNSLFRKLNDQSVLKVYFYINIITASPCLSALGGDTGYPSASGMTRSVLCDNERAGKTEEELAGV